MILSLLWKAGRRKRKIWIEHNGREGYTEDRQVDPCSHCNTSFHNTKAIALHPLCSGFCVWKNFSPAGKREISIAPWVCQKYGAQKALRIPRKKSAKNGVYLKFRSFLSSRLHSDAKMRFLAIFNAKSHFHVAFLYFSFVTSNLSMNLLTAHKPSSDNSRT